MYYRLRNRNVLVTGGAGFIGSHLCEAIAKKNPKALIIVDNLFLGKKENLDTARALFPHLKLYKENICNYNRLKDIILRNSVEVVFNLAVIPLPASLVKPRMAVEENTQSVLNLCELARKKYFKTLIHCSSSEVYGTAEYVPMDERHPVNPTTPYAASKASGDNLCLSYATTYGIDIAIARPFNNYGPRQNAGAYAGIIPIVINNARRGKPVEIYGDGNQSRDFIFVRDTARALIRVYETRACRNRIINIASGKEVSINKLVRLILNIMGCEKIAVKHSTERPGDVRRHCADITLAKKIIAFKPTVSLEEGLRETVKWYLKKRG